MPHLITKAPELNLVLKFIDENEDVTATLQVIASHFRVPIEAVANLASDLWSFLTLNLQGTARVLGKQFHAT